MSLELAAELGKLQPLLQHYHIAEAGHGMPYDEPDQVGVAITRFLKSL